MSETVDLKIVLERLFAHETLDLKEAGTLLYTMAEGGCSHSQIAAVLAAYRMRTPTVDEVSGFREALLDLCVPVDTGGIEVVDLCGTGGDGKDTFNISTIASFVVAAAGIPVAKHGNYGVSSGCGASNLLEKLGVCFTNDGAILKRSLDEAGVCFLHAPLFHPAMKQVAPVRKELGVRTFFNILGPLVNPARPAAQVCGVFSPELQRLYGYVLERGAARFAVIHSFDGYDEISLTGQFRIISRLEQRVYEPEDFGLPRVKAEDLRGGTNPDEAAKIARSILQGSGTEAQLNVVAANAGMAIACADEGCQIPEALERAKEALASGKAAEVWRKVVEITKN